MAEALNGAASALTVELGAVRPGKDRNGLPD